MDIMICDDGLDSRLLQAAQSEDYDMAMQYIKEGANVNYQGHWTKDTPLHFAVENEGSKLVELLVKKGANLELLNSDRLTPLLCTCICGSAVVANKLLDLGADPNYVRESDGSSAIKFAASSGAALIIKALLKFGVTPEHPESSEQSPLMLAARGNHIESATLLLEFGADPFRVCGLKWALGKDAEWMAINEEGYDTAKIINRFKRLKG